VIWNLLLSNKVSSSVSSYASPINHSLRRKGKDEYEHDGLTWWADWRVILGTKKVNGRYQTRRNLVISLPSDGYFYVDAEALKSRTQTVKKTGRLNPRHLMNGKDGWTELEREVWGKLAVFKTHMADWFEEPRARNATRTLSYHTDANRIDICMKSSLIAIEPKPTLIIRDTTLQ
jgi:hypothetical protein